MFVYIGLIMRQISCHPSKFYAYLSRLRWIKRWGLMCNAEPENVMEHSWEVAVVAHALALIRNQYFMGTLDANSIATAALFHDVSEVLTGDLPTPIKYFWAANTEAELKSGVYVDPREIFNTSLSECFDPYRSEISSKKKGASQESYRIAMWQADELAYQSIQMVVFLIIQIRVLPVCLVSIAKDWG